MLLRLWDRQLNIYLLLSSMQFFDEQAREFTNGECQIIRWPNFPSTTFEQQIAWAYASRECWTTLMHILKHPALCSIHADPLQGGIDGVARRYVSHPGM